MISKVKLNVLTHEYTTNNKYFSKIFRNEDSKVLFFPGCSFISYSPNLVLKVYNYLRNHYNNLAISTICCNKPTEIIDKIRFEKLNIKFLDTLKKYGIEEIITCCPNCTNILSKSIKVTTVYDILSKDNLKPSMELSDIAIHDPCAIRNHHNTQENIREILKKSKYDFEEFSKNKSNTVCCGKGNMLFVKDRKKALSIAKDRAYSTNKKNIVTYCFSCKHSFLSVSKNSFHILELFFGEEQSTNSSIHNRFELNKILKKEVSL